MGSMGGMGGGVGGGGQRAITEMSEESYDSIVEQNIQKGYDIGYRGSRQFLADRKTLPYQTPANQKLPVFNSIGKLMKEDLTKVPLPVAMNEPLSMLQKPCEALAYIELLEKAVAKDSLEKLIFTTVFCLA
jgi:hypothetical protein